MSDASEGQHTTKHGTDSFQAGWRRRIHQVERYFQEQRAKRAGEEAEQKAARNTARATVVIAFFTIALAVVGWLQYQEVQDSSDAMDRMNRIYRAQTAQLGRQAGETHDLAVQAKNQSDNTHDLALQAKNQAQAELGQLAILHQQMEFQRPWFEIEGESLVNPTLYIKRENGKEPTITIGFSINVKNTGVSPARLEDHPRFVLGRLQGKEDIRHWNEDLCKNHSNIGPRFLTPIGQNSTSVITGESDRLPLSETDVPESLEKGEYTDISGCVLYFGPTGDTHWFKVVYHIEFDRTKTVGSGVGIDYHPILKTNLDDFVTDSFKFTPH